MERVVRMKGSAKGSRQKPGRKCDEATHAQRGENILCAALEVFAGKGFAAADVQQIADRVGVGKGTVYRQFGNKECLFLATARHAHQFLVEAVEVASRDIECPLEKLRRGMYAFLSFFDDHPEVVELLIQERAHFRGVQRPTFFEHRKDKQDEWAEVFRRMIRAGMMRDLPVEQVEEAITKFLFGIMFVNYFAGREKPLAQQCDEIFDVLFHGLLAEQPCPTEKRMA
jgi:AcrR family transcriptional regulator